MRAGSSEHHNPVEMATGSANHSVAGSRGQEKRGRTPSFDLLTGASNTLPRTWLPDTSTASSGVLSGHMHRLYSEYK
jgi:hypothetical protein